jgi:UrcA family protein
LALAAPAARAQGDDRNGGEPAYYQGPEQVQVTVPRPRPQRGEFGAPIRDVALTRNVRYDDLDLTTNRGARQLKERIDYTARALCQRLDAMYPVAVSDSPPCYRTAMRDAMFQANAAIDDARNVATND